MGVSLARCAARYAWWKAVPDPAIVTPCSLSTSTTRSGTNASNRMLTMPVIRLVNSHVMPPMWVNGKASALRSWSVTCRQLAHALGDGVDGRVGVAGALRVGGRARRVEEPAHRRRPSWAAAGSVAGSPSGSVRSEVMTATPSTSAGDRRRPSPRSRSWRSRTARRAASSAAWRTQKPDLALAVDRQHRVLHRAEPRDGADQDHRLEPRRQLPGDHVAGADAVVGERARPRPARPGRDTRRRSSRGRSRRRPSSRRAWPPPAPRPAPTACLPRASVPSRVRRRPPGVRPGRAPFLTRRQLRSDDGSRRRRRGG